MEYHGFILFENMQMLDDNHTVCPKGACSIPLMQQIKRISKRRVVLVAIFGIHSRCSRALGLGSGIGQMYWVQADWGPCVLQDLVLK